MIPILTLTQDVPEEVVNKLLEVSPYNALGYGALVVVLIVFIIWTRKDKKEEASRMEKFADALRDIEIQMRQLDDIKQILLNFNWRERSNDSGPRKTS